MIYLKEEEKKETEIKKEETTETVVTLDNQIKDESSKLPTLNEEITGK